MESSISGIVPNDTPLISEAFTERSLIAEHGMYILVIYSDMSHFWHATVNLPHSPQNCIKLVENDAEKLKMMHKSIIFVRRSKCLLCTNLIS